MGVEKKEKEKEKEKKNGAEGVKQNGYKVYTKGY